MKYTISEFAHEIRKLYPGDYDDLTDKRLVELWITKYPEDKNKVDLVPPKKVISKEKSSNMSFVVLIILLLAFSAVSKPDYLKHRNEIVEQLLAPTFKKMVNSTGIKNVLALSFLGSYISNELLSDWVDESLDYRFRNVIIFNKMTYKGKTISYGFFGIVYIPDKVKVDFNNNGDELISDLRAIKEILTK